MHRIIINAKQELILIRSTMDNNSYSQGTTAPEENEVIYNTIIWKKPHISVLDEECLKLLKVYRCFTAIKFPFMATV